MLDEQVVTTETHVLHPHRHLLISGVIAALALTTPVFAVAYWLTISAGTWPIVIVVHLVAVLISAFVVLRYQRTTVTVSPEGIRERGFLGGASEIRNDEIGSLCLVEIYRDSMFDTQPNLFILDTSGSARIRMRGQYWSRADMDHVSDVLDRPIVNPPDSVTLSELRSSRPDWLYWFERVPLLSWL
ncbi:hypothetical protein HII28_18410 [Planctomonas sp. JC2975]|uniref:hypothetical protein n=1 Tax=Planctomonas sp. JC2975 TaxID=2729626 RepID=UPI001474FEA4|nr:hypothetical protein [Planctomonas sp. JC2975]NNC13838.1 hypothetical protein [Planctomonas sp. JC2975]